MFYLGIRENRIKQFKVFFKKTVFLPMPSSFKSQATKFDRWFPGRPGSRISIFLPFFIYLLFEQRKDSGCINGT